MNEFAQNAEKLFADAKTKFGFTPNIFKEMVKSPVPGRLYLQAIDLLAQGALTPREQQAVQLAVATENRCGYCSAAHTAVGKMTGIDACDLEAIGQGGVPSNPEYQNVVEAAKLVLEKKGWLDENDLARLEEKGIDRARLYEIVTLIGLKTITNYINHIAGTPVDDELK